MDIGEMVKELIQNDMTVENISLELKKILFDPVKRLQLIEDYTALRDLLGRGGNASANAAKSIYRFLATR